MQETQTFSKDEIFRQQALGGNLWQVVLKVGAPLALYQLLSQLFKVLDAIMASHISSQAVSAVAYLSQINLVLLAVGGGLALGGSLKISQNYGAGDYELIKKQVSSLIALTVIVGLLIMGAILPFTKAFLRLANTPFELIEIGSQYFSVELIAIVVTFFNNVYIAIERVRGHSRRILVLNLVSICTKIALTAFFVYVLDCGVTMIAVATLISQCMILVAAVVNLSEKQSAFSFSLRYVRFSRPVIQPMLHLSFPAIVERTSFSLGKVVVNSMSGFYGALTVGALGISNNICGLPTSTQVGFQEGGAAIISQNVGAGNPARALKAFKVILALNVSVGAVGYILTSIFLPQISALFANSVQGYDADFQNMIMKIYSYDAFGSCVPLAITSAIIALLLGFGYMKYTLFINVCRLFVFRIPVLWALQRFTSLGSESVGVVMMVSNLAVTVMAVIVATVVIREVCTENDISFWKL